MFHLLLTTATIEKVYCNHTPAVTILQSTLNENVYEN